MLYILIALGLVLLSISVTLLTILLAEQVPDDLEI